MIFLFEIGQAVSKHFMYIHVLTCQTCFLDETIGLEGIDIESPKIHFCEIILNFGLV